MSVINNSVTIIPLPLTVTQPLAAIAMTTQSYSQAPYIRCIVGSPSNSALNLATEADDTGAQWVLLAL